MSQTSVQMYLTFFLLLVVVSAGHVHHIQKRSSMCLLPPYPKDGQYEVAGYPSAVPGDEMEYVFLNVSCTRGKGVEGNNVAICIKGEWSTALPQCVSLCQVIKEPSAEYTCQTRDEKDFRQCNEYEPDGTLLNTLCIAPYYPEVPMQMMKCVDGIWKGHATCTIECGIIPKNAPVLPWHATIYRKETNIFKSLCGGTIITSTVLLSAAHCYIGPFDKKFNHTKFAAAVGKSTQGWDVNEQKYLISDIKLPSQFYGRLSNFQSDIAILKLEKPIQFSEYIRPLCLNFDRNFERHQLQANAIGTISVWPRTGSAIETIQMPYIPIDECIKTVPTSFREYITSDKMCAGWKNGTVLCKGNSGSGLAFPTTERGVARYYLRGIVSTSPTHDQEPDTCTNTLIAYTLVSMFADFIKPELS